ncbi:unnamed protein product [Urochloa humidicola]
MDGVDAGPADEAAAAAAGAGAGPGLHGEAAGLGLEDEAGVVWDDAAAGEGFDGEAHADADADAVGAGLEGEADGNASPPHGCADEEEACFLAAAQAAFAAAPEGEEPCLACLRNLFDQGLDCSQIQVKIKSSTSAKVGMYANVSQDEDLVFSYLIIQIELEKYMAEVAEPDAKSIHAAAIDDAVFTKEVGNMKRNSAQEHGPKPSHTEEDHKAGDNEQPFQADEALMVNEDHKDSDVHVKYESSEKPANNIESSNPAISVAEMKNAKLDKLEVNPKISKNSNQESSSPRELSDAAINVWRKGGSELRSWGKHADLSESWQVNRGGSSGQNG